MKSPATQLAEREKPSSGLSQHFNSGPARGTPCRAVGSHGERLWHRTPVVGKSCQSRLLLFAHGGVELIRVIRCSDGSWGREYGTSRTSPQFSQSAFSSVSGSTGLSSCLRSSVRAAAKCCAATGPILASCGVTGGAGIRQCVWPQGFGLGHRLHGWYGVIAVTGSNYYS